MLTKHYRKLTAVLNKKARTQKRFVETEQCSILALLLSLGSGYFKFK